MTASVSALEEFFGPVISTYTREQALADGVLVAANPAVVGSAPASIAYTAAVHADCIAWSDETERRKRGTCQDVVGREHDVFTMFLFAARNPVNRNSSRLQFSVCRVPAEGRGVQPRLVRLAAEMGSDGRVTRL